MCDISWNEAMLTFFSFPSQSSSVFCTNENVIFLLEVYLDFEHCPVWHVPWVSFEFPKEFSLWLDCWRSLARIFFILGAMRAVRVFITVIPLAHHGQGWWLMVITVNTVAGIQNLTKISILCRQRSRIICKQCLLDLVRDSVLGNRFVILMNQCCGLQFNNWGLI